MNQPAIESQDSPTGRDAEEYQWAEFNLPSDLIADHSAEAVSAPMLAPAPGTESG
jgi:hypothetical protein